jgi:hypothetical protein
MLVTSQAGFDESDILRLGLYCVCREFAEGTTNAVLFRDMVSIDFWNGIRIV